MATITITIETKEALTLSDIQEFAHIYGAEFVKADGNIKYSRDEWEDEDYFIKCCNDDNMQAEINGETLWDMVDRREREDERAEEEYHDRLSAEISGKLSY
jgi:hypothetical protein